MGEGGVKIKISGKIADVVYGWSLGLRLWAGSALVERSSERKIRWTRCLLKCMQFQAATMRTQGALRCLGACSRSWTQVRKNTKRGFKPFLHFVSIKWSRRPWSAEHKTEWCVLGIISNIYFLKRWLDLGNYFHFGPIIKENVWNHCPSNFQPKFATIYFPRQTEYILSRVCVYQFFLLIY